MRGGRGQLTLTLASISTAETTCNLKFELSFVQFKQTIGQSLLYIVAD